MCAGAMLIDLILKKKIKIEDKKIVVVDSSPTEDSRLDAGLLKMISTTRKSEEIRDWLETMRKYINADIIPEFLEELRSNLRVIIETKKSLKLFTHKKYKLTNAKNYTDLLKQICKGVINEQTGDQRIIALISLLYTSKGYKQLIPLTLTGYT